MKDSLALSFRGAAGDERISRVFDAAQNRILRLAQDDSPSVFQETVRTNRDEGQAAAIGLLAAVEPI
ncbi:MAG: hypothetical protein ACREP9_14365, partial [Candidatus Dormibacteraceae bacterium]